MFGTQIMCTVNEKTYNDKITLVCSEVEIIKKKELVEVEKIPFETNKQLNIKL